MGYVFVRVMDMPCGVGGLTVIDANGDYNVYINSRLSIIDQRTTYLHEKEHIKRNHFDRMVSVEEAERLLKEV